ncbi:MAG: sugar ABC transporter permease [Anaerolineae bacterium]|nr:sugar ABC transporter permease [Anaerolineae bacterium]
MPRQSRKSPVQHIYRAFAAAPAFIATSISAAFSFLIEGLVSIVDVIFSFIQRVIGIGGMPYVFVLPNLLIFGIFILFPMLLNFVYAFTGGTEFFPGQRPWVGTNNFEVLLTCGNFLDPNTCREDLFWRAVYNTTGYVIAQVSLMVVLSLITALILNRKIKARGFFRSVFFYPVLLSPIVVALIWKWILQENGVVNGVIVGLGYDKLPFLVNAGWARFWVVMISVWASMGFYTLILLAGLQSIPPELYEAAQIDGANPLQSFRNVTLPLLMPTMFVVLVLSLIRAVQVFDVVFAFTGGGPGTATLYLVQYIFSKGFSSPTKQYGLAASASLLMAGALIVLTLVQLLLQREEEV